MSDLRLLSLPPSPNNAKVRVAMGYKGLDYEDLPQDPQDRSTLVAQSGQPLTPVLVHGEVTLFDSAAILRYLDANFPGPKLYATEVDTMKKIENWELFARFGVKDSFGPMYAMTFGRQEQTAAAIEAAVAALERDLASAEDTLAKRDWLVGDHMTAADVTLGSLLMYQVGLDHPVFEALPVLEFIRGNFSLDAARFPHIHDWVRRVLAYDRWMAPALAT